MSITHNLNKSERHEAHLSRFPHDMSQLFGFTMSTGMILPMFKDFLNVGETVYLKHSMIARTQPIITAAMADVHFYVDWFFVPATMLFTPFGQYRWQTNDFISDQFADGFSNLNDGYFPLFDIDYQLGFKSAANESDSTTYNYGGYSSSFGTHVQNSYRLADHLAYNPAAALYVRPTGNKRYNPNVFPIFALAYQSIYQKYYRDETWERLNLRSYNVDSAYQNPTTYGHNTVNERNLFQLRFANWKKDYFTSVRPQPYLSSLNLLGSNPDTNEQYNPLQVFQRVTEYLDYSDNRFERYNAVNQIQNVIESTVGSISSPNGNDLFTQIGGARKNFGVYDEAGSDIGTVGQDDGDRRSWPVSALGTAQLRNMFAVEKLMRIVGMSKKDYDHQALAHFGFKVPHDVKHDLTHIFGNHGILHIGEIISTADTANGSDGAALGQVGGKGYLYIAPDKKAYKFTAPVDGVLMAVSYCVPDVMYYDTFEKQNAITDMQSLYNPEFDKLGSQPLFNYEVANYTTDTTDLSAEVILGWQYRFEQYKRKFNRLTVAFSQAKNGVNVFGSWFIGRSPYNYFTYNNNQLAYQQFKCPPTALDNIMVVPYNINYSVSWIENPHLIYQTDPFICQFSADVKKLSTMSPYGEPDLNGI